MPQIIWIFSCILPPSLILHQLRWTLPLSRVQRLSHRASIPGTSPHPLKHGVPITQPAPTLWNSKFLLHSSFQELYLCSVILLPQKPQVGWHCLYFPPEIWELESLRKFPRNPRSSFSCQATEPLFFNIFSRTIFVISHILADSHLGKRQGPESHMYVLWWMLFYPGRRKTRPYVIRDPAWPSLQLCPEPSFIYNINEPKIIQFPLYLLHAFKYLLRPKLKYT